MPVRGVLLLFLFYLLNPLIFPFMPKDVAHEKSCAGISACTADECLHPLLEGTILFSFETDVLFKRHYFIKII